MHSPRSLLVTGGAGFIGANFVRYFLDAHPEARIANLDSLTYAGSLDNLRGALDDPRHTFIHGDIANGPLVLSLMRSHHVDTVVHFAAESHVDRSIDGPAAFVHTNVLGTFVLLEAAREVWGGLTLASAGSGDGSVRFHQVSTDEVYGSLNDDDPPFTERTPYAPNSPYSASKAAADHLVRAYAHTYGLPITITNCSNNYGPLQHPEKFIPTVIAACLAERPIPVYGTGRNIRDWLHVRDHCTAIDTVLRRGAPGGTYLVGADNERRNIELTRIICRLLDELRPRAAGSYEELISFVTDRAGHDFRYAIDAGKLTAELGWKPDIEFETGLRETIEWYVRRATANAAE